MTSSWMRGQSASRTIRSFVRPQMLIVWCVALHCLGCAELSNIKECRRELGVLGGLLSAYVDKHERMPEDLQIFAAEAGVLTNPEHFEYRKGRIPEDADLSTVWIVRCRPGEHRGRCVLYADGTVQYDPQ